jgi:Toxin SymE, type I toxin-antitoxin system
MLFSQSIGAAAAVQLTMAKRNDTPKIPAIETEIKPQRFLTVQLAPESWPRETPWIRLRGKWLAAAGFPLQTRIKVRVMKGCLVITPE